MGLLDGDIADLFAGVFGSFYLDGLLTQNPVWVPDGSGGGSYEPQLPVAVKYQEDAVDERTRAALGYSQDDVRFIILQRPAVSDYPWVLGTGSWVAGGYWLTGRSWTGLDSDRLVLTGDSELTTSDGRTYLLRTPRQDPAKSYWEVWGVPN